MPIQFFYRTTNLSPWLVDSSDVWKDQIEVVRENVAIGNGQELKLLFD